MKCSECYWNFDNQCICDREEVHNDVTQYTDQCIGYLDKDFENHLWDIWRLCKSTK